MFHGRCSACSLVHFPEARDKEDFAHPGLITLGMVHPFVVPGSVAPLTTKVGKRLRDPIVVPSFGHDEAETEKGTINDLIEAFNEMMRTACPSDCPAS